MCVVRGYNLIPPRLNFMAPCDFKTTETFDVSGVTGIFDKPGSRRSGAISKVRFFWNGLGVGFFGIYCLSYTYRSKV